MPGIAGEPFPAAGRAGEVQDNAVKPRVGTVPVAFPVFRRGIQFDISRLRDAINAYPGV